MKDLRKGVFELLFKRINVIQKDGPKLIAIDGVDGAGKSQFAKDFVHYLKEKNQKVIYSSVDHFHNPRMIRHCPEMKSHIAYFLNSFNYKAVKEELLDPIAKSTRTYCMTKYFDYITDERVAETKEKITSDLILIFEGIFSNRDELKSYWDFSVFLDVTFDESYKRMSIRDGCSPNPEDDKNVRYYHGQKIYFERCHPKVRASVIIDNNDYKKPFFK